MISHPVREFYAVFVDEHFLLFLWMKKSRFVLVLNDKSIVVKWLKNREKITVRKINFLWKNYIYKVYVFIDNFQKNDCSTKWIWNRNKTQRQTQIKFEIKICYFCAIDTHEPKFLSWRKLMKESKILGSGML